MIQKKPSQTATAFKNGSNNRKCDFGLGCHGFVVEVGGLSDEGVHLARIDLSGGGVIDKGDCREFWQAIRSAGLGSIGVCGACYRRPLGLRAYIEFLPVFHNPRTPTA